MKKFLRHLFLFLIPFFFFTSIPFYSFWWTGENFVSEVRINEIQNSEKSLIGYYYNESNYRALKKISIEQSGSFDIMVLGSSRVTQFRDFMFKNDFFNSGYTITTITQAKDYLESMPEDKVPPVVFLGLDQWMFNANWDQVDFESNTDFFDPKTIMISSEPNTKQYWSFWKDLVGGRVFLPSSMMDKRSINENRIGINANFYQMGFRNDGSFSYGAAVKARLDENPEIKDYGFQDTFERIEKGVYRFEYGQEVNPKAIIAFEELVNYCREKKIKLVSILLPFAPSVIKKLQNSGNHQYIHKLPELLSKYESENEVEIWNFTDVVKLGSSDEEFLDGFHAGEVCDIRILIHLAENNSLLKNFTDLQDMRDLIRNRKNSLELKSEK